MARQFSLAVLAALAAFTATSAPAQYRDRDADRGARPSQFAERGGNPAAPVVIDTQLVTRNQDQIVFRLPRAQQRYSELTLRTNNSPILIMGVEIIYADGQAQRFEARERLEPGEASPPILIEDARPPIVEVIVQKRPTFRPDQGTLSLEGLARPQPRDRGQAGGPVTLDRQVVNNQAERFQFRTANTSDRLESIAIRAIDGRAMLGQIDVDFGNGERQSYKVLDRLEAGSETLPISFGRARRVESVTVTKRPSFRPGRSSFELIGIEGTAPRKPEWGGTGPAIPRGWVLFGTQTVSFRGDRDVIPVGRDAGRFERVAFRVLENDIYLRSITVIYGNGERDEKIIESPIGANSQTRAIDLKGDRFIDSIELVYRSRPGGQRAIVEVYGDFARDWISERSSRQAGWVMLGAQRASMLLKDNDTIPVGERFGRLKNIRLHAKRADIRIYNARIIYGNGEVDELPLNAKLRDGETSPVFELPGHRGRYIDRIELRYRSKLDLSGPGTLELWGTQ